MDASDTPQDSSLTLTSSTESKALAGVKRKLEGLEIDALQPCKSQKTYTKHEVHWDSEGNVLLQIGDTRFKRNGIVPEEPYRDQDEINAALATAEKVDGMDLFHLDEDWLTVCGLACLLTAMNNAIDYAYKAPPALAEVVPMLNAANFFRMYRYEEFCYAYIRALFPDRRPLSRVQHAVLGVTLGRRYISLSAILRPAFYELARAQPSGEDNEDEDEDDQQDQAEGPDVADEPMADNGEVGNVADGGRRPTLLERLNSADLVTLLDLQKRLSMAWNDIEDALVFECQGAQCQKIHQNALRVGRARRVWPFDPLRGALQILQTPAVFANAYCAEAAVQVRAGLRAERTRIWADINVWLGVEDAVAAAALA